MFQLTRQRCGRAAGFCFVHVSQEGDKFPMFKFIEIFVLGYQIRKAFAAAAKAKPAQPDVPKCGYCGAEDPYKHSLECHHCGGN